MNFKPMKKITITIIFLLFFSLPALAIKTPQWPHLDTENGSPLCIKALHIGQTAFISDNFYLYAPPSIPENLGSVLAVGPEAVDISGGNALTIDEKIIKRIPEHGQGAPRDIGWQIQGNQPYRWVITAVPHGWRGDAYMLYAVSSTVSPDQFLSLYDGKSPRNGGPTPLIDGSWRPPLLLQENTNSEIWAIDVGQPFTYLSEWVVYTLGADGAKRQCAVKFRPDVKAATDLLPTAVRDLARLLEKTQATHEDGTLQPTARIRSKVNYTWANVAMRPWALKDVHNSREEVDTGLKDWSLDSPYTKKLYRQIYRKYPTAEQSLKKYYQTKFKKSPKEAASLASSALDIAFRTYFMFPGRQG